MGFIPGMQSWVNNGKSVKVIYLKKKKKITLSIDAEKALHKIQYLFMTRIPSNLGIRGEHPQFDEEYEKNYS